MRKYLLNGLAALTMGLAMTSCMQEFNFEEQEQQASLDNAQQTLGFYIPANQDWVMSTTATATFNVKGLSDEATLYVFSNYPEGAGYGSVLASGKMTGTTTTLTDFRIPSYLKQIFVGLQQSDGSIMYKYVDVEEGNICVDYDFSSTTKARTRSIIPEIGDPFTKYTSEQLKTMFKTEAPSSAKTWEEMLEASKRSDWGGAVDYSNLNNYSEMVFPTGTYGIHLWYNSRDIYIDGEVTLNIDESNSLNQARIYLLPNSTLHFNMNKYINNLEIYVANNATLYYNAEKLYKQDGGGVIFNRGTLNLQDNFEANQNAIVYNEGTVNGKDITSKPGDGNPSYFYNYGDLNLKGKMELNSCANFYNEGKAEIAGETNVTQKDIYWINNGHYTTGTMIFSAKNATFYNYCQLIIKGNAHMYDGAFNLMNGSYTEAGTAEFDNFYVNLGANSGFNVKGDSYWGPNGDGEFQGFNSTGDNNYVRLGGTTTIAEHRYSLVTTGNIKIAFNEKVDLGANNSGVWPTFERRDNSKVVDFSELNVTPNEGDCGATWSTNPPVVPPVVENNSWTYAFEDNKTSCDFDLNDVVIQVRESETDDKKLIVKLVAAGCQYDNYVWLGETPIVWEGGAEVHDAFGADHGVMINTGNGRGIDKPAVETIIDKPNNFSFQDADFMIRPFKINSEPTEENATSGYITIVKSGNAEKGFASAPLGIVIPDKWKWPQERVPIPDAYAGFISWGKQEDLTLRAEEGGWYQNPTGLVYEE
jgi:hypothetical protein